MGIVVAITMLLGLMILRPTPWSNERIESQSGKFVTFTMAALFILGLWNCLWYGLRHLGEFWGWASIISGVSMIAAALIIWEERNPSSVFNNLKVGFVRSSVVVVLALSLLLYVITLIQLNMGLPIMS